MGTFLPAVLPVPRGGRGGGVGGGAGWLAGDGGDDDDGGGAGEAAGRVPPGAGEGGEVERHGTPYLYFTENF